MKFTDLFIRRPVLAIVVNLVIIIAGLQAIRSLNVRQYPKLESATVTVPSSIKYGTMRSHSSGTLTSATKTVSATHSIEPR